ncbi:MAG: matrixin family metalloprotease [Archangium sp.]|nr:matrixin family metalloprotease [Archangium sp.]
MKRAILTILALAGTSALAQVPVYLPYKMVSNQQQPFPYHVDNRPGIPLDATSVRNAVERAWDSWNAVQCAAPKVRSQGPTSGVVPMPLSTSDQFSVSALWMTTFDSDAEAVFGNVNFVVAVTIPRAYAGVLQTCDTYFNSFTGNWTVDATTPPNLMDVETVMLHEAGHCLGLDHFGSPNAVMNQAVEAGTNLRALSSEDISALCTRNPNVGEEGAPCAGDGGCNGSLLKCLPQPITNGVSTNLCSKGCGLNTSPDCALPLSCQPSSAFMGYNGACLLPGALVTQVGKACADAMECGSAFGVCRDPEMASGGNFFWVDGYCTQRCENGDPACPAGSACVQLDTGRFCTQSCRIGLADCRAQYACAPIDTIGTTGVCIPRCYADQDCADTTNFTCRTCDGLCVPRQNIAGAIGDICNDDTTCGAGQSCRVTSSSSPLKQCTQQCARGCSQCPNGTTCTPGARNELFCLRDCTGPGTCPLGLRCADTSVGKSCLPQCNNDPDCPVGQFCSMGECYTPNEDASCGTLCMRPDAGGGPVVIRDAGGNTGGGTGGCGCVSSTGASTGALPAEPFMLLAFGLFVLGRRVMPSKSKKKEEA